MSVGAIVLVVEYILAESDGGATEVVESHRLVTVCSTHMDVELGIVGTREAQQVENLTVYLQVSDRVRSNFFVRTG